jgi:hypothetical protein
MTYHSALLKPYPFSPLVPNSTSGFDLRFIVNRHPSRIDFSFTLEAHEVGALEELVIPRLRQESDRERRDELWKHTCLEIFFGPADGSSYFEFNLSPSGDWNLYTFDSYREGMRRAEGEAGRTAPRVRALKMRNDGESQMWEASLEPVLPGPLVMGAASVLEYRDGRREYWALEHFGPKPDFHMRESFLLRL